MELTPEQKALFPELTDLRQQIENLQVKYLDVFGHCCFSRLVTAIFDVFRKISFLIVLQEQIYFNTVVVVVVIVVFF